MSDDVLDLAGDLRRLRLEGGALTYEAIARSAGLSRSIVAEAFGGTRLPSERTLYGVVTALGADPDPWLARRATLASGVPRAETRAVPESATGTAGDRAVVPADEEAEGRNEAVPTATPAPGPATTPATVAPPPPPPPASLPDPSAVPAPPRASRARRAASVLGLAGLVAVSAFGGALAGHALWPREPAPTVAVPPGATINAAGQVHLHGANQPVAHGANIWDTKCIDDAIDAATTERDFDVQLGIRVSFACETVWAVAYRNDGDTYGNDLRLRLYPKTEADPGEPQEILVEDGPYAVTTMIVQESLADDRFCAEGWVINDGVEVSLGDPICA
ncbi:hypothetical protein C8046_07305 [Serinibacter arcticus]|uniref:HTH cro/C1-type domain-containing protein n=1 Tax=Serinibacter arcticus TaxID=1655435 RepID=A0A2U1ZU26_9MICO|nr:helix-turn-helix transcriptional regulator [Serinibacter arcticus]PWD50488.1 hypothetical protein C8046_07305 [Serinibacter arcticus]